MKEFEKWFLKGGAKIDKHKDAESKAWRAALRMVQTFADAETCSRIDDELYGKNG